MLRLLAVLLLTASAAVAQVPSPGEVPTLSEAAMGDSLSVGLGAGQGGAGPSSADPSAPPIDLGLPVAAPAPGGIEKAVRFTARDSIRVRVAGRDSAASGDRVTLFGGVETQYETTTIAAGRVDYDAGRRELRATALPGDSTSRPRATDAAGEFTGETFVYNLRTERGRVTRARTAIEQGFLLGGIIKQQDAHVVFAQDAAYTTCDLDHPHYAVEAGRIKIVDGEEIYTGPVRLTLLGIPMPLFLPFGYFPAAEGRRSGPLAVDYGSDSLFGLFLGNLGWYWAISDYFDAQVAGKVGTAGSFQLTGATAYNRRYAYNGRVSLSYGRLRTGESTDPGFAPRTPIAVRWNHNQTFPTGQRLTASVNLQSTSQRQADETVSNQIQSSTTSSVSFSQQWPSVGRSLNVQTSVNQNFLASQTTATLPQLSFTQQPRFPFRRGRDDNWWERVRVSYSATATNGFSYRPVADSSVSVVDALFSADAFRRGACPIGEPGCGLTRFDYNVRQTVPVSASFQVPRFNLSVSPSLNFSELWVDERQEQTYDAATNSVDVRQVAGFTAVRQASLSLSASTQFFGTFPVRVGRLDGLRHTVSPQLSLSYQPDYQRFGFVREVQIDAQGNTRRYGIVPNVPTTSTRTLGFSVDNAFTARTVRVDSTGEETRSTRQVLSLNLASGYNFGDSRTPLEDIRANFTTQLFGFNASGNAVLSAYAPDTTGAAPELLYNITGRPVRLNGASLQVSRTFPVGAAAGPVGRAPRCRGGRRRRSRASCRARSHAPCQAWPRPPLPDYDPGSFVPQSATVGFLDYSAAWSASVGLSIRRKRRRVRRRADHDGRHRRQPVQRAPDAELVGDGEHRPGPDHAQADADELWVPARPALLGARHQLATHRRHALVRSLALRQERAAARPAAPGRAQLDGPLARPERVLPRAVLAGGPLIAQAKGRDRRRVPTEPRTPAPDSDPLHRAGRPERSAYGTAAPC